MSNQYRGPKQNFSLRIWNNACIYAYAPTWCMTLRKTLRTFVPDAVRALELTLSPSLSNVSTGDLLSRASCFDSKSSRDASALSLSLSQETHEWFSSSSWVSYGPFLALRITRLSSNILSRKRLQEAAFSFKKEEKPGFQYKFLAKLTYRWIHLALHNLLSTLKITLR